jgi:hypothetical protein
LSEKKHAGNYRGGSKMLSQAIKSTGFLILGIIVLGIITGCSGGGITPEPVPISGDLEWAKSVGGTNIEYGEDCSGITTLSDNSTVVTGWFPGSATFGKSETNETVLTSAGKSDIFIARFAP